MRDRGLPAGVPQARATHPTKPSQAGQAASCAAFPVQVQEMRSASGPRSQRALETFALLRGQVGHQPAPSRCPVEAAGGREEARRAEESHRGEPQEGAQSSTQRGGREKCWDWMYCED